MKVITNLLSAIVIPLLLLSCKKDKKDPPPPQDYFKASIDGIAWTASSVEVVTSNVSGVIKPDLIIASKGDEKITLRITSPEPGVYLYKGSGTDDILPATLLTFTGTGVESSDKLAWSTGIETNINRFELEISADGTNWSLLTTVLPAGPGNYEYLNPVQANETMSYYRLKVIDNDNAFAYSSVITITTFRYAYYKPAADTRRNGFNGETEILSYDRLQKVIEGTFHFQVKGTGGTLYSLTGGEFRVSF